MIDSYFHRGLDALAAIADDIGPKATIAVPDYICDEVWTLLKSKFAAVEPYRITHNLLIEWGTVKRTDVFYSIDYFGREAEPPAWPIMTIRDAVWMPAPARPIEDGQYWFNSARKFAWPLRGSKAISHGKLAGGVGIRPDPTPDWPARRANYAAIVKMLGEFAVDIEPGFPSVVAYLKWPGSYLLGQHERAMAERGIGLPGLWANAQGHDNPLYLTLGLISCDERWGDYWRSKI